MDLTVARLRQVSTAIAQRTHAQDFRERQLWDWSVRTQAVFVASTVPTAKGKKNKLREAAEKISLFSRRGPASSDTSKEPAVGSYERLMAFAGRLTQPR